MNVIATIEDLLEVAAGMTQHPKIDLDKEDITIMHSVARQIFKGTALTDRQFALMQEKLLKYKDQFNDSCDFDTVVKTLRNPLRHIDRSKYIKLQDDNIVIRFPFRKTDIMLIQEFCSNAEGYSHSKGTHEHSFAYTESNVLNLLDRFNGKEFEIDNELLEMYSTIKTIHSNPQEYLSGISNNNLINVNSKLKTIIKDEIGSLTEDNLIQHVDRRFRYGFDFIDLPASNSLANKIAARRTHDYQSKPSIETTDALLSALWELDRFPMLVVLDPANAEEQLYEFANYYRDILQPEEQSVLFRLEDSEAGFNQLIKDRKLNNWVDKTTKIVYINKNKLPKILINNDWKPIVAFSYNSKTDRFVDSYISFNCDLIVYREETMSPFRKYSKFYG